MRLYFKLAWPMLLALTLMAGCKQQTDTAQEEISDYGSDRNAVVEAAKSGKLQANASGVAVLPEEMKAASMNGQVYLGSHPSAGLLIVFPVMKASGRTECLLYAEKPLPDPSGVVQVAQWSLKLSGQSKGKWHQASIGASPIRR